MNLFNILRMDLLSKMGAVVFAFTIGCTSYQNKTGVPSKNDLCQNLIDYVALQDDLSWVELDCDKKVNFGINGTKFYACKEDISEELIDNMELIADVKKYARDKFGFLPSLNYLVYQEKNPKVSYSLTITPKTKLSDKYKYVSIKKKEEHRKKYNKTTKLGSQIDDLLDEKEYYKSKGYDIYYKATSNFNDKSGCNLSLDWFKRSLIKKISVIFHEDWHYYVDIKKPKLDNNNSLEESAAVLIGRAGAVDFVREKYGESSKEYIEAEKNLKYWYDYSLFINKYYTQLDNLYYSNISKKKKLDKKDKILKNAGNEGFGKLNNSTIVGKRPYTKHFPLMYEVYRDNNSSMEKIIMVLKGMPDTADEDKVTNYLKKFLK